VIPPTPLINGGKRKKMKKLIQKIMKRFSHIMGIQHKQSIYRKDKIMRNEYEEIMNEKLNKQAIERAKRLLHIARDLVQRSIEMLGEVEQNKAEDPGEEDTVIIHMGRR